MAPRALSLAAALMAALALTTAGAAEQAPTLEELSERLRLWPAAPAPGDWT